MPGRRLATRLRGEEGSTLAALMVIVAIMAVMLTVASQEWSFILRREKERELIFRGQLIVSALEEYEAQGRGAPVSLDQLTKRPKPALRMVPPDPMTARYDEEGKLVEGTGQWKLLRPGTGAGAPKPPGEGEEQDPAEKERQERAESGGPILGVASRSEELSIGAWNDVPANAPYSSWKFQRQGTSGQPGVEQRRQDLPFPPGFGGLRAPGGPPVVAPPAPGKKTF